MHGYVGHRVLYFPSGSTADIPRFTALLSRQIFAGTKSIEWAGTGTNHAPRQRLGSKPKAACLLGGQSPLTYLEAPTGRAPHHRWSNPAQAPRPMPFPGAKLHFTDEETV